MNATRPAADPDNHPEALAIGTHRDCLTGRVLLEVHFDVVCPWCWLGHRRLHDAIGASGLAERIELRWRSFQLDPRATREPQDLATAVDAKYGTGAHTVMARRLGELGREAGLEFRFERAVRVTSFDAHRLVQEVQRAHPGSTGELIERLFRAYFTEGADISDPSTLLELAGEVGLPEEWTVPVLGSEAGAEAVRADIDRGADVGITGVPAVTYNGATVIPGAQDTETVALVLKRLVAKHS